MRRVALALALALAGATARAQEASPFAPYVGQLRADEQAWFGVVFAAYRDAFVTPDGRVLDPQNDGVSHSESQGYGMLLALLGNDPATFDSIWRFTRATMQREDKLFGWKYVPGRGVVDWQNATDGDLFIATALALAGSRWTDDGYLAEATAIADSAGRLLIHRTGDTLVLLPGLWAQPGEDEPAIVNFSYYDPMALAIMQALTLHHPWDRVLEDGRRMIDAMDAPPSDWSQVDRLGRASPADGRAPMFGYDAVRIPLYLLQGGVMSPTLGEALIAVWGTPGTRDPFSFDVLTDAVGAPFGDISYRFAHELLFCVSTGSPVSQRSIAPPMTNYYASSLHMMGLAALYASYPQCFPAAP